MTFHNLVMIIISFNKYHANAECCTGYVVVHMYIREEKTNNTQICKDDTKRTPYYGTPNIFGCFCKYGCKDESLPKTQLKPWGLVREALV